MTESILRESRRQIVATGSNWYLSFYSTLLNDVGVSNQTVLLLDNPGLELHVDGQRDIKRFLEEKVSLNSQVLYVTHSPAMIDPFNLHQVRAVELLGDQQGTKVRNFAVKKGDNSDLLEPVRCNWHELGSKSNSK